MPGSSTRVQHKDFFIWITFLFLSLQNSANKLPHAERTIVLSKFVKLLSRISKGIYVDKLLAAIHGARFRVNIRHVAAELCHFEGKQEFP